MIRYVSLLVIGGMIGIASSLTTHYYLEGKARRDCAARYPFVNESAICSGEPVIAKTSYFETQKRIEGMIDEARSRGVTDASVYFRDLRHGPVFGVDELASFAPASLIKIPIALVFLDAAKREPELLDAKLVYDGTSSVSLQTVKPEETAVAGQEYALRELLRLMLTHSDNASYEALEAFLDKTPERRFLRQQAFQELGFIDPETREERTLTVRGYASLFTLIHNASFLDAEHSDLMLGWLADSQFADGLRAGVPGGLSIAHKFGERTYADGLKELHDCGITYFPDNPYLLCVMTRGADWDALAGLIADISRVVYEEVYSRQL